MTRKVYKSAMGKTVDLGALLLQNEQVKAVGNMGVNAAGDLVDSTNQVIDRRNRQIQRQYRRQSVMSDVLPASSTLSARKIYSEQSQPNEEQELSPTSEIDNEPTVQETVSDSTSTKTGGLAAAIARSREIKQVLEKTTKQLSQESPIRKI